MAFLSYLLKKVNKVKFQFFKLLEIVKFEKKKQLKSNKIVTLSSTKRTSF